MADQIEGTIEVINKKRDGLVLAGMEGWFNVSQFNDPDAGPLISPSLKAGQRIRLHFSTHTASGKRYMEDLELLNGAAPAGAPAAAEGTSTVLPEPVAPPPPVVLPEPLGKENAILFQVCLKAAQEWVIATELDGVQRSEGHVLYVADLYYVAGLKLITGETDRPPPDGDPGPEAPA